MAGFREASESGNGALLFGRLAYSCQRPGLFMVEPLRQWRIPREAATWLGLAGAPPVRDVRRDEFDPPGACVWRSGHALDKSLDRHPAQLVRRRLDRRVGQREQ